MSPFIMALYLATLVFTLATYIGARAWQALAMAMARNYATSPAPTPSSAIAWYGKRARYRVKRYLATLAN